MVVVPVITPEQLSVAVGGVNELTEQSAIKSLSVAISATGDSESLPIKSYDKLIST